MENTFPLIFTGKRLGLESASLPTICPQFPPNMARNDSPFDYMHRMSNNWLTSPHQFLTEQKDRAKQWWEKLHFFHIILKIVLTIVCFTGCGYQCAIILNLYLSYPTTVYVYVDRMINLETPGITLCNNNRLVLSKLMKFNESFATNWLTLSKLATGDDVNDTEINLKKQALIDDTMRHLIEAIPVNEFMKLGHTYDEFLQMSFFKCAADEKDPSRPCRTFANIISTAQSNGNCFTLFHRSYTKLSDDVAVKAGLSQSPVLKGSGGKAVDIELAEKPFRPNEVLRLMVNFTAFDYTTLNEPVFGSVVIHDANSAPGVRTRSYNIKPGQFYDFFIIRQTSILLPPPYATDCMNYTSKFQHYYEDSGDMQENIDNIYKYPLSREDCIVGCMGVSTVKKCNCWPPELPFISSAIPKGKENSLKWCDWDTDEGLNYTEIGGKKTSWFNNCFSVHEEKCTSLCKYDCRLDRFAVVQSIRTWPADERIEHSKRREELEIQHKCCAIVSIRYWDTEHTIHQYQTKFEPIELMSYLSGLVSMWLGFSILGIFGIIENNAERTVEFVKEMKNKVMFKLGLKRPEKPPRTAAGKRWNNTRVLLSTLRGLESRNGVRRRERDAMSPPLRYMHSSMTYGGPAASGYGGSNSAFGGSGNVAYSNRKKARAFPVYPTLPVPE